MVPVQRVDDMGLLVTVSEFDSAYIMKCPSVSWAGILLFFFFQERVSLHVALTDLELTL